MIKFIELTNAADNEPIMLNIIKIGYYYPYEKGTYISQNNENSFYVKENYDLIKKKISLIINQDAL